MKINDREFTDEEFATIVQLACDVCGYLQDRVKKPIDLLVTLSLAAFMTQHVFTKGGGGEHKTSDVMMWLTRDIEEKCTATLTPDGMLPFTEGVVKPPKA